MGKGSVIEIDLAGEPEELEEEREEGRKSGKECKCTNCKCGKKARGYEDDPVMGLGLQTYGFTR